MPITISVCMIVKNESPVLERCLSSLEGIADELIIVDTGSSDDTMEIARQFTELVFSYPWGDDFAAARNFSTSKATKDYVYTADADEVIDADNRQKFLRLKSGLDTAAEIVQMYYANQLEHNTTYNFDRELRPKMFKRLRGFEFAGAVHEALRLVPVVVDTDIEITHKPHESHAERDLAIFRKITAGGVRLPDRLGTMYARELYIAGGAEDFLNADGYFVSVMEDVAVSSDILRLCQCVLARGAFLTGDNDNFFGLCIKQSVSGGLSAELCCMLGDLYLRKGDYAEARLWYFNAGQSEPEIDIRYAGEFAKDGLDRSNGLLGTSI